MPEQPDFQKRLESIESLLATIDKAADPNLRATVQQIVQLIMDLHGAGVERMLELIRGAGDNGTGIVARLGRDELVGSLLVLYGLHPLTLEERVAQAIDKHRGEVALVGIQDGAVRLSLSANVHRRGLKEKVEAAVLANAPDVTSLVIEGADEKSGFVPLEMILGSRAGAL